MYVTDWCPYCARARGLLEAKGVAFREIDVEAVPGAQAEMVARSGRSSVPQIFIGEVPRRRLRRAAGARGGRAAGFLIEYHGSFLTMENETPGAPPAAARPPMRAWCSRCRTCT